MKQIITNPNEVDWLKYWQEALKQKTDKNNCLLYTSDAADE